MAIKINIKGPKINVKKDGFTSPTALFIYYMIFSALGIMGFRFVFQGENPPIPYFARNWGLTQGIFELLSLFPALAMTGLVIPFGFKAEPGENYARFSPKFFQRLTGPIIIAICAAVIYGLLFFLVQPMIQDFRTNMRYESRLYRLSRERAEDHAARGEWPQVSQFIGLCEGIWPNSPELAKLKIEADIQTEEYRIRQKESAKAAANKDYWEAALSGLPGQRQPVNVIEALAMAETARQEERWYDAHWLATLGTRLAKEGSPEEAEAARAASLAWNSLNSMAPNAREEKLYSLYHLKQSGYQAMIAGEWIRAYYIFLELSGLTPSDPDVANFLANCEKGTHEIAFFTDEMDMAIGEALTSAVYSVPTRPRTGGVFGRGVLRFSSISYFSDVSYAFGLEFISFDAETRLESHFEAPYAKIIPMTLDGQQRIVVIMRALDRYDKNKRWEPTWIFPESAPIAAAASERSIIGDTQIILDMSYENFFLLSSVKRGVDNLSIGELFTAAKNLGPYGYIPQVFESEAIYRLCEPLIFLPVAILVIVIGWRFRAKKTPPLHRRPHAFRITPGL
ncbi:hypothetical protein AGMMS50268_16510 [Spirochaetia bacterium]|nr:hypothetical protein AGMMS50268_16510 [Spirochaetia bacterium]